MSYWSADDVRIESATVDSATVSVSLCDLTAWTLYHVEVSAITVTQQGPPAVIETWTEIGTPDRPPAPRVNSTGPGTITVVIQPAAVPRYGPLSAYFIVVSNSSLTTNQRRRRTARLLPDPVEYFHSLEGAVTVAELSVDEVDEERLFVVGDGQTYGRYDNAPLQSTSANHTALLYSVHYVVASSHDSVTKMNYSSTARPGPTPAHQAVEPWSWVLGREAVIGIAVSVSLLLSIIVVVLIMLICWRCCRTHNDARTTSSPHGLAASSTLNASWLKYYAGTYQNSLYFTHSCKTIDTVQLTVAKALVHLFLKYQSKTIRQNYFIQSHLVTMNVLGGVLPRIPPTTEMGN